MTHRPPAEQSPLERAEGLSRMLVELQTERFVVRTLLPEDVGIEYAAWFDDPVIRSYIEWRPQSDAVTELRTFVASHLERQDSLLLGVFILGGRHVANLKYEPIDLEQGTTTLGVLIGDPKWRGRGLFREAFAATVKHLHERFGIRYVDLGVDPTNAAAIAAYERSGFRRFDDSARGPRSGQVRMGFMVESDEAGSQATRGGSEQGARDR
jgi:ribosomal-protein-alanine N-acetyltransferase